MNGILNSVCVIYRAKTYLDYIFMFGCLFGISSFAHSQIVSFRNSLWTIIFPTGSVAFCSKTLSFRTDDDACAMHIDIYFYCTRFIADDYYDLIAKSQQEENERETEKSVCIRLCSCVDRPIVYLTQ